jgi:transcriptional/translational regulatory protein YebC/TACO1
MEAGLEIGAEDVVTYEDGSIDVLTAPDEFLNIKSVLQDKGHEPESAEITMRASTSQKLDLETAGSMLRLLDMLEDLDDVQKVYSNADIPEDVIAQLD